jgi:hypothetical protein
VPNPSDALHVRRFFGRVAEPFDVRDAWRRPVDPADLRHDPRALA